MEYLAGRITEAELLDRAGNRQFALSIVYFTIAMMRLAERDPEGAREQFEKCIATSAAGSFDFEWARAYLARMEADPTWPKLGP